MRTILTVKSRADSLALISDAFDQGLSVFRVNFARRALTENLILVDSIRSVAHSRSMECLIFGDTPGIKRRVATRQRRSLELSEGENVALVARSSLEGSEWAVDDDILELIVHRQAVRLKFSTGLELVSMPPYSAAACSFDVVVSGSLHRGVGFIVEGLDEPYCDISDADRAVIAAADVLDVIALSFSDTPQVVRQARSLLPKHVQLVAKIETPAALRSLPAVVAEAEGAMLARGDLSRWFSAADMLGIGINIRNEARARNLLSIFATDYLKSLSETGVFDWSRHGDLASAIDASPDFLLVNETSHSPHWPALLEICAKIEAGIL